MAINKVIYGGKTLIDLTGDTITPDKLLAGYTAHDKSGEIVEGTCPFDVDSTDATATAAEILSGITMVLAPYSLMPQKKPNSFRETSRKASAFLE